MKILAIETSCDETAVSIIEAKKGAAKGTADFEVLGNALSSQAKLHAKYGGVFPMMAKREHSKNLIPLLKAVLAESGLLKKRPKKYHSHILKNVRMMLEREPELAEQFLKFIPTIEKPPIGTIAVTYGPGLEPALWVGINFAKALSLLWKVPVVPVNHMEGHIFAALLQSAEHRGTNAEKRGSSTNYKLQTINYPLLALLISGGHTELVRAKKLHAYAVIGETRDDAAGECFDKAARMLSLPYPGGPYISALAQKSRKNAERTRTYAGRKFKLPRPMIGSKDYDFSFSGLKTAVLYLLRKLGTLSAQDKADIAKEIEDAIADVLVSKTLRALEATKAKTLILGGGVSANKKIRARFADRIKKGFPEVSLFLPEPRLTTDNALMIAVAGYLRFAAKRKGPRTIAAQGNLRLTER